MKKYNFLTKLSKHLFWDYNIGTLDPNIDRNLILARGFSRGTENDEKEVFNYYGKTIIKESVLHKIKKLTTENAESYFEIVYFRIFRGFFPDFASTE
jgi:hypothetical protein